MTNEKQVNNGGTTVATQPVVQKSLYDQAWDIIQEMVPLGSKFQVKEAGSGNSIFDLGGGRGTRLLKLVQSKKGLRVEFNVKSVEDALKEVPANDKITYTEQEAKDKHMGTCQWIYTGSDLNVLRKLVEAALAGFQPKAPKEIKKKEDAPKAEAPAQTPPVPVEPPKANRPLTEEEKKKLGVAHPAGKKEDKKEDKPAKQA